MNDSAVRAAVEHLRTVDAGEPLSATVLADEIARSLNALLLRDDLALVYRPASTASGWMVSANGPHADMMRARLPSLAAQFVLDGPRSFFRYHPLRPEAGDRNVARTLGYDDQVPAARAFLDEFGPNVAQTRVILCDGPLMLAWVGVLRPKGEPADTASLRALALAVRPRLRLALGIPQGIERATFEATLDAYPGEAYVVRRNGRIELANRLGAARLASSAHELQDELALAVAHPTRRSGFDLHPLRGRALSSFFLVTRATVAPSDLEARLERASSAWKLTPRHVAVLRRLALGDANKDIAARLDISVRTVEVHVAAMMLLANVDSRLRLVARLWSGA